MDRQGKIKFLQDLHKGKVSIKKLKPLYDYDFINGSKDLYKCKQTGEVLPYSEVMKELEGLDRMDFMVITIITAEKVKLKEPILPMLIITVKDF